MRQGFSKHIDLMLIALVVLTGVWVDRAQAQPGLDRAGALAADAARVYREQARYPESSRVIPAGAVDPIREKRVPAPHSLAAGKSDSGLMLTVWPAEVSYQPPAPVVLMAAVTGGDTSGLTVTGEVVSQTGESLGQVVYKDDGRGVDEAAGDGVFTGRFVLPPSRLPALAESFLVKIEALAPNGEVATAAGGFLVSNPQAAVTGRFRDRLADGDLVVEVQVEVAAAGRFHLAGTLYSLGGEAIGWAQTAQQLEPGKHWLELSFFGLMFHEHGVAGPYRLGTLALSNASGMPNALADLVENAHVTRAYPLQALSAEPFDDRQLLDAAARLEIEAAVSRARAETGRP